MKLPLSFLPGAICATCILLPRTVLAQTCYYPNGDVSTSDYPCSSNVEGLCCPLNWQCLSNGLCYLDNEQYYGRYTCTDQTWSAPGCPEICTDGLHPQHFISTHTHALTALHRKHRCRRPGRSSMFKPWRRVVLRSQSERIQCLL